MMSTANPPKPTLAALKREVGALRDPARAKFLQSFFRTGPGEYAEGDKLLGLTVPDSRKIARTFRDLPLPDIEKLIASEWHEHRLMALLLLVDQHQRGTPEQQGKLHRFYLDHLDAVNNWDLVDGSAATLVVATVAGGAVLVGLLRVVRVAEVDQMLASLRRSRS